MSDWSSRRKAMYMWSAILVLTVITFFIFWNFWYKVPTCFDSFQNGDEEGIDCGGSCSLVCSAAAAEPLLRSDPRVFNVVGDVYSVLAFVENRNVNFEAPYVPYRFRIYDASNKMVYEREGVTAFLKNGTISLFEGNILIPNVLPKRAELEISKNIRWTKKVEQPPEIELKNSPLLREETAPRIEASISNKSIKDVKNIELVAVVFDGRDNAIAASRTFIERLNKNVTTDVFFTWPTPFTLGEKACEIPSSIVLALDRSGSMASFGTNPVEPLTSVKLAAKNFIAELKGADLASVVSFATEASVLTEVMTNDFASLQTGVDAISVQTSGTQYTNIADAIYKSFELLSMNEEVKSQKIVILLTDGTATYPLDPKGSKTEAEEIAYAEKAAEAAANTLKQGGAVLYTIGLGKDVNKSFLSRIASSADNFLEAPSTTTLNSVYKKISGSICKEVPARIEVSYKILGEFLP